MNLSLREQVVAQTEQAISRGALLSLPTEIRHVEDRGIRFAVHLLGNLPAKTEQARKQDPDFDPFLPWEPDLFVSDLGDSHICLLNKFNVVDHHILIVTRKYEEQHAAINPADMRALWSCLEQMEGVAFYNSAKIAGASQRHKHLQLAPLAEVPIEAVLDCARREGSFYRIPQFSFPHAVAPGPVESADAAFTRYLRMLDDLKFDRQHPRPYNFLITRRWAMMIPRGRERWREIAVNALGFAGSLLVRNEERFDRIVACGPTEILRRVAEN